ncbi:MAG TPA: chemotaxis protein CheV [Sedimenticola thiotaurini]|uniref:Chemotaxis protein CheV n=1 Tax=Sedimenticola thiotaurini TaxID=1543721 RepID=A0A831W781_9GAMM|nr:chemotaxis protein CheV [Sedimenticola thiotaurini]
MTRMLREVDQRTMLAGHNRLELLLFRLSTRQRFGINVFKVQEVIHCPTLTRIPGSSPVVQGVAKLRGRTITVMDLSLAIGGPPLEDYDQCFVIVTEYNRRVQGFLVGSVERIVNLNWEAVMPPPRGVADGCYMTAVTQVDDELVEIIDVEKVLKEVMGDNEVISDGIIDESIDHGGRTVMVVDDSSVARNQIRRVLEQLQVDSMLCNDGHEALQRLRDMADAGQPVTERIAMVISDVEMPKMDGYTLTASIRRDPDLEGLHVLLHSSLSGVFNEAMVKRVGANRFLAKYEPDELATIVQEQLKTHRPGAVA